MVPFAAGFRRLGPETHDGLATIHYRRSAAGERAYSDALHFDGDVSADLWIAADGRYLAAARIAGKGKQRDATSGVEYDDAFVLAFDVDKADDPGNVVQLPVSCRCPIPSGRAWRPSISASSTKCRRRAACTRRRRTSMPSASRSGSGSTSPGYRSRWTPWNRTGSASRSAARRTPTRTDGSSSRTGG